MAYDLILWGNASEKNGFLNNAEFSALSFKWKGRKGTHNVRI